MMLRRIRSVVRFLGGWAISLGVLSTALLAVAWRGHSVFVGAYGYLLGLCTAIIQMRIATNLRADKRQQPPETGRWFRLDRPEDGAAIIQQPEGSEYAYGLGLVVVVRPDNTRVASLDVDGEVLPVKEAARSLRAAADKLEDEQRHRVAQNN